MLKKTLDKLLAMHFKVEPNYSRLDRLESDIWRRIRIQTTDTALPWYDKMFMAFSVPQFRLASVAMALAIGLALSQMMTAESRYETTELYMFSANAPYLPSTLLKGY